jgi:hypothetical protein
MTLFSKVKRFARSPQGRKVAEQIKGAIERPEKREGVDSVQGPTAAEDKPVAHRDEPGSDREPAVTPNPGGADASRTPSQE